MLRNNPAEQVLKTFVEAFSDYEVPIQMPFEKFIEMMKTRDIKPDFSVGSFDGNLLVGFVLTGYREINGQKICCDGGTGVIKAYHRNNFFSCSFQYVQSSLVCLGARNVWLGRYRFVVYFYGFHFRKK